MARWLRGLFLCSMLSCALFCGLIVVCAWPFPVSVPFWLGRASAKLVIGSQSGKCSAVKMLPPYSRNCFALSKLPGISTAVSLPMMNLCGGLTRCADALRHATAVQSVCLCSRSARVVLPLLCELRCGACRFLPQVRCRQIGIVLDADTVFLPILNLFAGAFCRRFVPINAPLHFVGASVASQRMPRCTPFRH